MNVAIRRSNLLASLLIAKPSALVVSSPRLDDAARGMKAFVHRFSRKAFLGPLIVLPLLSAGLFAAVSLLTIRSWGFSIASGVVVFFGSFLALAVLYMAVDLGEQPEPDHEVDEE